jgi:CubicO group peptidase (beta-lactamase class C family)
MTGYSSRRTLLAGAAAFGLASAIPAAAAARPLPDRHEMLDLLGYVERQNTTGFLIVRNGGRLIESNWPALFDAAEFRATLAYEKTQVGALREDVAALQKSFVSMLIAIAVDRGLLDVTKPVGAYIGAAWSKAAPGQEAGIRVVDLLTMSSGLDTRLGYAAPPETSFLYNTPVYAVTKQVLVAAAGQPLEVITRDWLTAPANMVDTDWRKRPAALDGAGSDSVLVASPRDVARFGQIVLDGGRAADGTRILSPAALQAMFSRSPTNPAYGRLWWLNGGRYTITSRGNRVDGPLIPAAPPDLVAALGAPDRKLYIVPSRRLVVVRLGRATPDQDFDQQLWSRLARAQV